MRLPLPPSALPSFAASLALLLLSPFPATSSASASTGTARPAPVAQSQVATPVLRPTVVARYPHDPAAFTQGLRYLGGGLYLESTGLVGRSGIRVSALKTGKVIRQVAVPQSQAFGEGATLLGSTIYQITWQNGVAFAYDRRTLREIGRYSYGGEGWGLTDDGKSLIMSDGSAELVWRDPKTFAEQRRLTVTDRGKEVYNLNELEYVQGYVYANVFLSDRIARIHPQTGRVTAWIDMSALTREVSQGASRQGQPLEVDDVANGIAFVPERGTLLLTGKRWPTLFEVKVSGLKVESPARP